MIGLLVGTAVLLAVFLLAIMIWDSNRFVTVTYRMSDSRLKQQVKFAVLADLHNKVYGKKNKKLLQAIEGVDPDGILIAGDLTTSRVGGSTQPARDLLAALSQKYRIYYGNGNHEYRIYHQSAKYGSMGKQYKDFLSEKDIRVLEDDHVFLPKWNLCIYGVDIPISWYKRYAKTGLEKGALKKRLGEPSGDCFTILLAHNPDWFVNYGEWGADLTLAGHVHGGIIRLPGLGGVVSTSLRLFPRYDGGIFEDGHRRMIISRGLGSHTIPVRLFNPAELVIVELIPGQEAQGGEKEKTHGVGS